MEFNLMGEEIEHLRARLEDAEKIIDQLVYLASKATPTMMGGVPDMFWPTYLEIDKEVRSGDVCPWEFHEEQIRMSVDLAAEFLKKGEK